MERLRPGPSSVRVKDIDTHSNRQRFDIEQESANKRVGIANAKRVLGAAAAAHTLCHPRRGLVRCLCASCVLQPANHGQGGWCVGSERENMQNQDRDAGWRNSSDVRACRVGESSLLFTIAARSRACPRGGFALINGRCKCFARQAAAVIYNPLYIALNWFSSLWCNFA